MSVFYIQEFQNRGREIFVLIVALYAHAFGQLPGQAHCEGYFQGTFIHSVVIKIAIVLVEGPRRGRR